MAAADVALRLLLTGRDETHGAVSSAGAGLTNLQHVGERAGAGIHHAFDRVLSTIGGVGARLKGLILPGGIGALVGGAGAAGLVKYFVDAAMAMEGFNARMSVAMKSPERAAEMMAWVRKVEPTMPFPLEEIIAGTTQLEMYGLAAQRWLPLAGNAAGAMQRSLLDAVEAIADAMHGEFERLREFGITGTKLIQYGAQSAGAAGGVVTSTIEGQAKATAALEKALEATFGGGMAAKMRTTAGFLSNIQTQLFNIRVQVGEQILPVIQGFLTQIGEGLSKLSLSDAPEALGRNIGRGLLWAWEQGTKLTDWIKRDLLGDWTETGQSKIAEFGKGTVRVFGEIGKMVVSIVPAFETLADSSTALFEGLQAEGHGLLAVWNAVEVGLIRINNWILTALKYAQWLQVLVTGDVGMAADTGRRLQLEINRNEDTLTQLTGARDEEKAKAQSAADRALAAQERLGARQPDLAEQQRRRIEAGIRQAQAAIEGSRQQAMQLAAPGPAPLTAPQATAPSQYVLPPSGEQMISPTPESLPARGLKWQGGVLVPFSTPPRPQQIEGKIDASGYLRGTMREQQQASPG